MATQDAYAVITDGDQLDDGYFNDLAAGVITVESGENITSGNVVYIHLTDGKAYVSDANVQDKNRANGIALATVSSGADVRVQTTGIFTTTGLTDKQDYYLSATAGALTTTIGGVRMGTALSTTQLYLNIIQDDRDTLSTIKAFLPTHAGMIANPLTAFWKLCDGTVINDAESPLNNGGAGEAPDLNSADRFLRGNATSDVGTDDTAGGATTHGNHGPSFNEGASGSKTEGFTSVAHIPPFISVVFIMKIK